MIPLTHLEIVNGTSFCTIKLLSSHTRWTLYTALPSSLFRSGQLFFNFLNLFSRRICLYLITIKRIKSLWVSFYDMVFVAIQLSKIFSSNKQAFVNILEKLFTRKVIAYMVITGKGRSSPNM